MKLICELLFLAIFFAVFKVYGIYPAITSAIILYGLQLVFLTLKNRKLDKAQLLTFLAVLVLGGSSLVFHNELFFKWKPSIIYWALALGLVGAQLYRRKPTLESFMSHQLSLPPKIWAQLDYLWAGFLVVLGCANLAIAYQYTTEIWVNFKLFGTLGAFVVFILLQTLWLSRYAKSH
jgi:intracellular septation protein